MVARVADTFLRAQAGKLVVIDEVHRAPSLFETLRGIIDERRVAGERSGCFVLLGSATIELMRQAFQTLAGRIAYVNLGPIDALEFPPQIGDTDRVWPRGGFPVVPCTKVLGLLSPRVDCPAGACNGMPSNAPLAKLASYA